MLNKEQKQQFSQILEELGKSLDITKTEYDAAVTSYRAVAEQLVKEGSLLTPYDPDILPQGSFMLGTMIRPIAEGDDLDIDLVCQLRGKRNSWTQYDVKRIVGDQIAENAIYDRLLERPDGRRCWTLKYRQDARDEESKYHMDILPAIVDSNYTIVMEGKALGGLEDLREVDELAIRITDNLALDYETNSNHLEWLKSNPFGYGKWFFTQAKIEQLTFINESKLLSGLIEPVPQYEENKWPLQRIVQILKRHRDMMFADIENKKDKPISIIITTLAARAYQKEENILEGLTNVVAEMLDHIDEVEDPETGEIIQWISNPVNDEENFADKWVQYPVRGDNFFRWHRRLKEYLDDLNSGFGRGQNVIMESMKPQFGEKATEKAFTNLATRNKKLREDGNLRMGSLGVLGSQGKKVRDHKFYGQEDS